MFEIPYYPETIKKTIIGFGALFSNVQIIRRDQAGTTKEVVKVPIAYGPKQKFITRIDQDPELNAGVSVTVPRLGFEITGYSFRRDEMTNRNNKIQCSTTAGNKFIYTPVPYDISIQLYQLTKGTEDGLAIVEQILPLFSPEYSLTINALPEMNLTVDVPIILNGVQVQDDYEGDFSSRQLVTHVFDFTARVKMLGQIKQPGVILRTDTVLPNPMNAQHTAVGDPITHGVIDDWVYN